jgi:hypothetical protein
MLTRERRESDARIRPSAVYGRPADGGLAPKRIRVP